MYNVLIMLSFKLFSHGFTLQDLIHSFQKCNGTHSEEFTKYDASLVNGMRDAVTPYILALRFSMNI